MLVDLMDIVVWAQVAAKGVAVDSGEEEGALTLPVLNVDHSGDDGGFVSWCSILPVCKWLVAKHPIPLSVNGVADCSIGEDLVVGVICVHACGFTLVCVAVALAEAWDERLVDVRCVSVECLFEAYTVGIRCYRSSCCYILLNGISTLLK